MSVWSKRVTAFETHRLLTRPEILSARCALQTRTKLVCHLRFVHAGSAYRGDMMFVPLTLHSYRQTLCVTGLLGATKCSSAVEKTVNKLGMIIPSH